MSFLPGFDDRWVDVPDYIIGITKKIWEDREILSLHDHYGEDLIVRSPASVVHGNAGIIAATEATLAEFPDRDAVDWTRDLIAREGGPEHCVRPYTPANDVAGPYTGRGNDNEWGQVYADLLERLFSAGFSVIPAAYDRAVELAYPSHLQTSGHSAADKFWLGLRSAFPNAVARIDHVIGMEDPLCPPRASVRFSIHGKHEGYGMFGTPTGATVFVMGIAHAEFGPRGVRREWALIDETAIWKQILLATGAV